MENMELSFNEVQELKSMEDIVARAGIQLDMMKNGVRMYIGNMVQKRGLDTSRKWKIENNMLVEIPPQIVEIKEEQP